MKISANGYKFCDGSINKFCLILRKGVYPYEHINSWEKFNETSLPDKNEFYISLNMKGIIDKDYEHAKRIWEDFKLKNLGLYHDM